jgi:hypothetical protein
LTPLTEVRLTRMPTRLGLAVVLVGLLLPAHSQKPAPPDPKTGAQPARTVRGQTLKSPYAPAVEISFDPVFRYAGGQRFVLYDIADAEQHIFVDADADRRVRRMFWVQFEGFLPSVTDTYNYRTPRKEMFGDLEFMVDVRPFGTPDDPKSDGAHVLRLLESKGLRWPQDGLRARLIHLPDPDRRKELMVIYVEPASATTEAQIVEHAKALMKVSTAAPRRAQGQ